MERLEAINTFYENYNEQQRFDSNHGAVEFLTTIHYIEKYLTPGMTVVEIGAGTGRYSHYFARNGYEVDAIELVEHNVKVFRENTLPGEKVTVKQGDAIDLSDIPSDKYDITLLLGPMYHLYTEQEQKAALGEALRVTKPDGVLFVAYCNSDMTMYQYCFGRGMIHQAILQNKINTDTFKLYSLPEDVFQLYRREDIDALTKETDAERLHYVGTDMLAHLMRDTLDAMDQETFAVYMKYHMNICERPDMVGATNHILDVLRKKQT